MRLLFTALTVLLTSLLSLVAGHTANHAPSAAAQTQVAQPPIADPDALVAAYYQQLATSVNTGDFTALVAFFAPDAGIDTPLSAGGASGSTDILRMFKALPPMTGFTVETSNQQDDDPYIDVDWRWRAAPGSLRGYLDGHDSFKISNGLIAGLTQDVDKQSADEAFMPPVIGPVPRGTPMSRTKVRIADFKFAPQVIQVPVGATVTWTNDDSDPHAVTTVDKALDAGIAEEGVSVTLTFPVAGTYQYYCTVHPGMRGTVIAGSAPTP